jgi:hypothetical protein
MLLTKILAISGLVRGFIGNMKIWTSSQALLVRIVYSIEVSLVSCGKENELKQTQRNAELLSQCLAKRLVRITEQ